MKLIAFIDSEKCLMQTRAGAERRVRFTRIRDGFNDKTGELFDLPKAGSDTEPMPDLRLFDDDGAPRFTVGTAETQTQKTLPKMNTGTAEFVVLEFMALATGSDSDGVTQAEVVGTLRRELRDAQEPDISPASIRGRMADLVFRGYLEDSGKPSVSSGRKSKRWRITRAGGKAYAELEATRGDNGD
jgi:hypothetical protein